MNKPYIVFVTTPIRPIPTTYPPIAVLSILNALKTNGYDRNSFYNIDYLRPDIDQAVEYIVDENPDILAISAVVSTAYDYVKELTLKIKTYLPNLPIILGGPLAASAEIVLRRTGVDFLCTGEGEMVLPTFLDKFVDLTRTECLASVPGLVYLDQFDDLIFTGYADPLEKAKMYEFDWEDINDSTQLDHYFPKVYEGDEVFCDDERAKNLGLIGKRSIEIPGSKGCVAKCTFCHRWDKGIRYIPIPILMERIKEVQEKFDVGFIRMADENFGTDRKWLDEFCREIKKLDLLWMVSGMRVNCISGPQLKMMKEAGCTRCVFGMETGSPRMLKVMNKGVKIEDNFRAIDLIHEYGLSTTVQLVIGMPGETNETVRETGDFLRHAVAKDKNRSPFDVSINYAQALPGTPLFEYARHKGHLGKGIDGEEDYLLWVSDKNANDDSFVIPELSGASQLNTLMWRPWLVAIASAEYLETFGSEAYWEQVVIHFSLTEKNDQSGYFNFPKEGRRRTVLHKPSFSAWVKFGLQHPIIMFPKLFSHSNVAVTLFVIVRELKALRIRNCVGMVVNHLSRRVKARTPRDANREYPQVFEYSSLRKTVNLATENFDAENIAMKHLRKGRW
jgi:anaerobic magnesium-protoporphyrin IX monomethyl ester cyclase